MKATGIGDAGGQKGDWHQARLNLPIFRSMDANADVTYEIWCFDVKDGWINMMKRVCGPTSLVAYKVTLGNGLAHYQGV